MAMRTVGLRGQVRCIALQQPAHAEAARRTLTTKSRQDPMCASCSDIAVW